MGLGLMVLKGAFALPPWWFGGLRDFSYAGLQFAAILLLWIAWTGRDIALARSTSTAPASPDVERSGTDVSG
jgi:hypothetical protein